MIGRGDKEGAAKILGSKNAAERLRNILRQQGITGEETPPDDTTPPGSGRGPRRRTGGADPGGWRARAASGTPGTPPTPPTPMAAIVMPSAPTGPVPSLTTMSQRVNTNPPAPRPLVALEKKPVDNSYQQINLMRQQIKISKGMSSTLDAIKKKLGTPTVANDDTPQQPSARTIANIVSKNLASALEENAASMSNRPQTGPPRPQDITVTVAPPRTGTTLPERPSNPPRQAPPPSRPEDSQKAA